MAVKYLHWNNLIGEFLFSRDQEGKIVTLVLSEDDLISIAKNSLFEELAALEDQEIIDDYKSAWRSGYPGIHGNYIEKILQEDKKALSFYHAGKHSFNCDGVTVNYHPTLMHLAGINLAIIEGNDSSRYKRIRDYFKISDSEFPHMTGTLNWNIAWDNLIWWANSFKKGNYGLLPAKSLSTERFEYMGKPYTFIFLSRNQLNDYYKYFFEQDVEPQAIIGNGLLKSAFNNVRRNDQFSKLLAGDAAEEDQKLILTILRQLFLAWDGSYTSKAETSNIKFAYQSRKLRLCFKLDDNGYLNFSFRFKEETLSTTLVTIDKNPIKFSSNQWSSPITIKTIPAKQIFTDDSVGLKLVFKPLETEVFVFINGRSEGLNSEIYIETGNILYSANQFLLISNRLLPSLETWIDENEGLDSTNEALLDSDKHTWTLLQFNAGFKSSHPGYEKLQLPLTENLTLHGGLKTNDRGTYITGFPVFAKLSSAKGTETLILTGADTYSFVLEDGQFFKIPISILSGQYEITVEKAASTLYLPNDGQISFVAMTAYEDRLHELPVIQANPEENNPEAKSFKESTTVVANNIFQYPVAPQLTIWRIDELKIEAFDNKVGLAIKILEYLITKGTISKITFDNALSSIAYHLSETADNEIDFHKLSNYSLNGLKESSRAILDFSADGLINKISPVKPFLFQFGNYQNFYIKGLNTGIQPFKGYLYGLGGSYSLSLLKQIRGICQSNNAHLTVYQEGGPIALVPPTVFIYTENKSKVATEVAAILDQETILPYYRYLSSNVGIHEKINEFTGGRMWDLHTPSRFQFFDTSSLSFQKKPEIKYPGFPSLSLYQVQPWERYFILRFEINNRTYQGSIDPRWGKYITLYFLKIDNLFFFDQQKNTFLIPAPLRLPAEIEGNLFYLTGRMPSTLRLEIDDDKLRANNSFRKAKPYLAYKGVLKTAAEEIARKVGQQLTYKTLTNNDRSV